MHIAHAPCSLVLTRSGGRIAGVWAQNDGIYEERFGELITTMHDNLVLDYKEDKYHTIGTE